MVIRCIIQGLNKKTYIPDGRHDKQLSLQFREYTQPLWFSLLTVTAGTTSEAGMNNVHHTSQVYAAACYSYFKGKGKGLDTRYSAAYISQTCDQQRFTISEVAADWHEPMVP